MKSDEESGNEGSDNTKHRVINSEGGEDNNRESEAFIQGVKQAIANSGTINRKHAHSMFVGPPESGKSSLIHRLLKRKRSILQSRSTGVCNPVVIVDISTDNPSTFHSVPETSRFWNTVTCGWSC